MQNARPQTGNRAGCSQPRSGINYKPLILIGFIFQKSWHAGCNISFNQGRDVTANKIDNHPGGKELLLNGLRFAKSSVSPAHLQQGLFLSLALLVTLIVVQQIVHWTSASQAAPVSQISMIHHTPFTAVAATMNSKGAVLSFTSDHEAAAKELGEMPQRQSWIF